MILLLMALIFVGSSASFKESLEPHTVECLRHALLIEQYIHQIQGQQGPPNSFNAGSGYSQLACLDIKAWITNINIFTDIWWVHIKC